MEWGIEIGRRPFDTQYSAVWLSLFGTFVPIERTLCPVYRALVPARAGRVGVFAVVEGDPVAGGVALETTLRAMPSSVSADVLERLLRAYVDEIPDSGIRAIWTRAELLNLSGQTALEPLGVVSGMVLAAITRASYAARLRWFQSLGWNCVSRLLRGLSPAPPCAEVLNEQSPPGLVPAVNDKASDVRHGNSPAQSGDRPAHGV